MDVVSPKVSPNQPPEQALKNLRAIASEHFDDYLMVVCKDGNVMSVYKGKVSAFGMASMICQDINHDWWVNRSNKI